MNNVMESKEFIEYLDLSINYVESSKKKNNNFDRILINGYSNKSHFIYELIQNADDAKSTSVCFSLNQTNLEFINNGIPFNFQDIKSITSVGNSDKNNSKEETIGKFGMGFKSVFCITKEPIIISGGYNVKIEDLFIAKPIKNIEIDLERTKIVLPFDDINKKIEVENWLNKIDLTCLLFMRNIESIEIKNNNFNIRYDKEIEIIDSNIRKISISSNNSVKESYLVFDKIFTDIQNDSKKRNLKLEVAYKLDDKNNIIQSNISKLFVFFQTEKETKLNFIIQGPYLTTPLRDNIQNVNENINLIHKISDLICESIKKIRDSDFFSNDFINNILPINKIENNNFNNTQNIESDYIYQTIFDKVKELFLSQEELLYNNNGELSNVKTLVIAENNNLLDLISEKQLNNLFGYNFWLDKKIKSEYSNLYNYLKNVLNMEEITTKKLLEKIDDDFLSNQSDEWLLKFYKFISKEYIYWYDNNSLLRNKKIIRLDNNTNVLPNPEHVFLPTKIKNDKFPTIKNIFVEDPESKSFFDGLGIKQPDSLSIIRKEIFPKYKIENSNIPESYFSDFKAIFDFYSQNSQNKLFLSELSNLYIILSKNTLINDLKLKKADECYLEKDDLKKYFDGYEFAFFIDSDSYKSYEGFLFNDFIKKMGIHELPKVKEIEVLLSEEKKKEIRAGRTHKNDVNTKTKSLEGLENFISNIKIKNESVLLWELIFKLYSIDQKILSGFYEWNSGNKTNNNEYFDSDILEKLTQNNWLFNNDNETIFKPSEIRLSELNDEYEKENNSKFNTFIKKLKFKSEDEKTIQKEKEQSENEKLKVKLAKYEELEKNGFSADEELEKRKNEKNKEFLWKSNIDANIVKSTIKEMILSKITNNEKDTFLTGEKTNHKEPINNLTQKEKDDIGYWGEEFVFSSLKAEYLENFSKEFIETENSFKFIKDSKSIEIIWINKNKKQQGIGRDIDIIEIENDKIKNIYIEVKSTISNSKDYFDLTEREWQKAEKEEDNYIIYRVYNAGNNNAKIEHIKNPYRKWTDGYLAFKSITIKC